MDPTPGDLGFLAGHRLSAEELDDGRTAADRRHRALVLVLERLGLLARDPVGDGLAGMFAGLERHGAELWQDLLGLLVADRSDVADDVDLGMTGQREVRPDADAIPPLQLQFERLDERVALQSGA